MRGGRDEGSYVTDIPRPRRSNVTDGHIHDKKHWDERNVNK